MGPREAGVGTEVAGGVVVLWAVAGFEVSRLDVRDVASLVERGEYCTEPTPAVRQAALALHHLAARVGTDMVGTQQFVAEAAAVEPLADGLPGGPPQDLLARTDVSNHGRIERHIDPRRGRLPNSEGGEGEVGDHAGSLGEPVEGFGAGGVLGEGDEVDGVAAVVVVAGPAAPTLMATMIGMDRDRRVVVVVVGYGAMPSSAPRCVHRRLGQVIQKRGEVASGEDIIDSPPGRLRIRRSA